jgi:hypothetical protein
MTEEVHLSKKKEILNIDPWFENDGIHIKKNNRFFVAEEINLQEHSYNKKCSLCGKRAGFGIILKCQICNKNICHRHEKEQFIRYENRDADGTLSWNVSYNYPKGKALAVHSFKCYQCRTGKIPQDFRKTKLDRFDNLKIFVYLNFITILVLSLFSYYGAILGLSKVTIEILIFIGIIYGASFTLFLISLAIYFARTYKNNIT